MLVWRQEYERAITLVTKRLGGAGFQVVRTFDLKSACADQSGICPHHGTAPCNCQMAILLVYGATPQPGTLMVHGCGDQTSFSLVDIPQQPTDPEMELVILRALSFDNLPLRIES